MCVPVEQEGKGMMNRKQKSVTKNNSITENHEKGNKIQQHEKSVRKQKINEIF